MLFVDETGSSSQNTTTANIVLWILAVVCAVIFFLIDHFARKKYNSENIANNQDIGGLKKVFKRDLIFLILNIVFLAIPYIAYIIFNIINRASNINQWFILYFIIFGFIFNILRKDPVLFLILKMKTFTALNRKYADGTEEVPADGASFFVCLLLFILKFALLVVYGFLILMANMILSIVVYPITQTIHLVKTHKTIKNIRDESIGGLNSEEIEKTDSVVNSSNDDNEVLENKNIDENRDIQENKKSEEDKK